MRRRYRYDLEKKCLVEVSADWTDAERRAPHLTEGVEYSNLRATDGTPIDSRKKRRDYMAAMGATDASDYSPEFRERRRKENEAYMRGDAPGQKEGRIEAIKRAIYEVNSRRR